MKNEDQNQLNNNPASEIFGVIKRHRENAYRKVNEELVTMYFEIGKEHTLDRMPWYASGLF